MPVHIANPQVVSKIDRLTRLTGLGKTAAVEAAVDRMLAEAEADSETDPWKGIDRIVAQIDRIPDRPDAFDPLEWDEAGRPR